MGTESDSNGKTKGTCVAERSVHTYFTYRTACGPLTLGAVTGMLTHVLPGEAILDGLRRPSAVTNAAATQIMEYLAGKRTVFTVPFQLGRATPFQQRLWKSLDAIPYGQTRTAAEVARALGDERSFRAVGSALRKNPLPFFVPAHRVVSARGTIDGTDAMAALYRTCLTVERRFA